jgi:hypothetical protein
MVHPRSNCVRCRCHLSKKRLSLALDNGFSWISHSNRKVNFMAIDRPDLSNFGSIIRVNFVFEASLPRSRRCLLQSWYHVLVGPLVIRGILEKARNGQIDGFTKVSRPRCEYNTHSTCLERIIHRFVPLLIDYSEVTVGVAGGHVVMDGTKPS